LAAIQRVKGVKEETVLAWLRLAAQQVERIEAILLANYRLSRTQLDAMKNPIKIKVVLELRGSSTSFESTRVGSVL